MAEQHATHTDTHATTEPAGHTVEAVGLDELFQPDELADFVADDQKAGRAIGKMLALIFLYTIFAMTIVGAWTWSVSSR